MQLALLPVNSTKHTTVVIDLLLFHLLRARDRTEPDFDQLGLAQAVI